jgi:hypothetical protein
LETEHSRPEEYFEQPEAPMHLAFDSFFAMRFLCGGSEWESNPPSPSEITICGFEDRESHRTPCASSLQTD